MRRISFLVLLLLSFCTNALAATEGEIHEAIQRGNHSYLDGKYEEALVFYKKAASEMENGYLFYNIGNCYYRLGKKGEALAFYLKAKRHIPSFQDLKANINYVKGERSDDVEDVEPFRWVKKVFFFQEMLSIKELSLIALIFFGSGLLFFLLKLFLGKRQFLWVSLACAFLFLVFSASSALKFYEYTALEFGIVTPEEVEVKSERSDNSVTLFKLHTGTHFQVLSQGEGWLYLELSNGKRGWLKLTDAALI